MGAIKGVGEAAVMAIVEERKNNGNYTTVFDFVRRINLRAANKKTFESLALSGGLDSFNIHRATYFYTDGNDSSPFLERIIRYGNTHQEGLNSAQVSLFGDEVSADVPEPKIPVCEQWSHLQQLKNEKDVVGFFISGHPLDTYQLEVDTFCPHRISDTKRIEENKNKDLTFAGIVTAIHNGVTKRGDPWGKITVEDYSESADFAFFGEDYVKFKQFMINGLFVYVKGRIGERFRNTGNFEFRVTNIQLLSELREKLTKSITINLSLQQLDELYIKTITDLIEQTKDVQPQTCTLQFQVIDKESNITLMMPSKKFKLNPSNKLIELLKELNLEYKLN
jgi:DNA polymerase-3 subunit alpha